MLWWKLNKMSSTRNVNSPWEILLLRKESFFRDFMNGLIAAAYCLVVGCEDPLREYLLHELNTFEKCISFIRHGILISPNALDAHRGHRGYVPLVNLADSLRWAAIASPFGLFFFDGLDVRTRTCETCSPPIKQLHTMPLFGVVPRAYRKNETGIHSVFALSVIFNNEFN